MIRLRGHTLLCLQGFRGEGYSPAFVDNLASIHRSLQENPEQTVELLDGPDAVCGACPHRVPSGCSIDGDASEESMSKQDQEVLARLGLMVGDRVSWAEVLDQIARSVTGEQLPAICGECRWLSLGYCAEGITHLRQGSGARAGRLSASTPNPETPPSS